MTRCSGVCSETTLRDLDTSRRLYAEWSPQRLSLHAAARPYWAYPSHPLLAVDAPHSLRSCCALLTVASSMNSSRLNVPFAIALSRRSRLHPTRMTGIDDPQMLRTSSIHWSSALRIPVKAASGHMPYERGVHSRRRCHEPGDYQRGWLAGPANVGDAPHSAAAYPAGICRTQIAAG